MAIVYYGEAAKREPEFYMVYLMLAKCLHTKRHYEAASGAYVKALDEILSRPKKTRCRPSERSRFSARCTAILQAAL